MPKRKLSLIVLYVAASLFSAFIFYLFASTSQSMQNNVTIKITNKGFEPDNVTVTKGKEVTFENTDISPHWPASDFHPTHEAFPEFDPQKALEPGENWSFTFDKEGSFPFHDHMRPEFTGVVQVKGGGSTDSASSSQGSPVSKIIDFMSEAVGGLTGKLSPNTTAQEPAETASEILTNCEGEKSYDKCINNEFSGLSKKQDFPVVLKAFREVVKESGNPIGCHQIAHEISRVYVEKNRDNWKNFAANAPDDCEYGFVHGSIEAYGRLSDSKLQITPNFIREICSNFYDKGRQKSQCVHVFGHMLLVSEKGNVNKSLDLCMTLKDMYYDQCFHGVFMENITKINLAAEGLASINPNSHIRDRISVEEVAKICDPNSKYPKDLCWKEMSHVYTFISDFEPAYSFNSCTENAPDSSSARFCVIHALASISSQSQNDPFLTKKVCSVEVNISNFQEECYATTALHAAASNQQNRAKVVEFCSSLSPDVQQACFQGIGKGLNSMEVAKGERTKVCKGVDSTLRQFCEGGRQPVL